MAGMQDKFFNPAVSVAAPAASAAAAAAFLLFCKLSLTSTYLAGYLYGSSILRLFRPI
jgi:hypothetical protein